MTCCNRADRNAHLSQWRHRDLLLRQRRTHHRLDAQKSEQYIAHRVRRDLRQCRKTRSDRRNSFQRRDDLLLRQRGQVAQRSSNRNQALLRRLHLRRCRTPIVRSCHHQRRHDPQRNLLLRRRRAAFASCRLRHKPHRELRLERRRNPRLLPRTRLHPVAGVRRRGTARQNQAQHWGNHHDRL